MEYISEDSKNLGKELLALKEKIKTLKMEQKSTIKLELDGTTIATQEEFSLLQKQCSNLERRINIINRGFPLFEKIGFENSLNACGMVHGWETLAQDLGALVFAFKNTKIRIPIDIQKKYKTTLRLKLFNLFIICWSFEPSENDELLSRPEDEFSIKPEKVDFYLFGSHSASEDIFLIAEWSD